MSKVVVKNGVVSSIEQLKHSTLGNPNWLITFEDGTSNRTSANQSISYWIGDHVVGEVVSVVLTPAGRITDMSVVREASVSYGTIWVCQDCMLHHANGECGGCYEGHEEEPLSTIGDDFHVAMGMARDEHSCRECEGHYDTDDALTSGVGIGEPVFCDGTCQPMPDECDCETNTFSTSQCEGCGSYLHGERHAMTLFTN
jgi:hypothetical protein